jgi:hypothetical protein
MLELIVDKRKMSPERGQSKWRFNYEDNKNNGSSVWSYDRMRNASGS